MSLTAPIVRLDDVDVDIDGRAVLRGISLELHPDRHLGVVGDNGSGKSTLLALLAGNRWPKPGGGRRTYDFGEGPERDAVTARSRIALVGHELQDLYFARRWNFRVRDIVGSGATRTDIPRRNPPEIAVRRADAVLAATGLSPLADRRLLELSRGQQRRVLIARALAFSPALLLLDEPTGGLDSAARADLFAMLEQIAAETPLVLAMHREEDLPGLVTDVARLDAGRLNRIAVIDRLAGPGVSPAAGQVPPSAAGQGPPPAAGQRTPPAAGHKAPPTAGDRPPRPAAARAQDGNREHEPLIAVDGASVWIDGRRVLDSIDWRLERGEHWLVTGANGAGKSTLLRLLHGELRPARGGAIRWPGLGDPRDVWTLRRRVALVSAELQARYLYPTRVFDAVASGFDASIGLTRRLAPLEIAEVESLLEAFGLVSLRDRLLTALSYGQRHRTLIARTLTTEPRVLLLDEPWEGLDTVSSTIVRRELARRMEGGTQIVCVSHVGTHGLDLNRALRLERGRIVDAGAAGGARGAPRLAGDGGVQVIGADDSAERRES